MSELVEDGDLDLGVRIGLVVWAKYRDLLKIRQLVREAVAGMEGARIIYASILNEPVYIVKLRRLRHLEELERLENQRGGDKKNG